MNVRERMQVVAFHTIYKRLRRVDVEHRRTREEDFVEALLATSDEAVAGADPVLVERWIQEYGSVRSRPIEVFEDEGLSEDTGL